MRQYRFNIVLDGALVLPPSSAPAAAHFRPPANTTVLDSLLGLRYGYDALDRVVERAQPARQLLRTFAYDDLGRLVRFDDIEAPTGCSQSNEFGWIDCDPIAPDTLVTEFYAYDKAHNLHAPNATGYTNNRVTSFFGKTLTYDADGHVTDRDVPAQGFSQDLTWNALGQLVTVANSTGTTVRFTYDGFGRRIRKAYDHYTLHYVLDADRVLLELDAGGGHFSTYSYYPGVDRPHAVRRSLVGGTADLYFLTDFPGSVLGVVDTLNTLVNQYRYRPFGAEEFRSEQVGLLPFRFHGAYYDVETAFYHLRNRYYDPSVLRFLSEDPIGLAGGINPYVFAGNDPANLRDPWGLQAGDSARACPPGTPPAQCVTSAYDPLVAVGHRRYWPDFTGLTGLPGLPVNPMADPTIGVGLARRRPPVRPISPPAVANIDPCVGAWLAAVFAVGEDLFVASGVGMAWMGVRTSANVAIKASAVARRLAHETVGLSLRGSGPDLAYKARVIGRHGFANATGALAASELGNVYGMLDVIMGLVPGANAGTAIVDALGC